MTGVITYRARCSVALEARHRQSRNALVMLRAPMPRHWVRIGGGCL